MIGSDQFARLIDEFKRAFFRDSRDVETLAFCYGVPVRHGRVKDGLRIDVQQIEQGGRQFCIRCGNLRADRFRAGIAQQGDAQGEAQPTAGLRLDVRQTLRTVVDLRNAHAGAKGDASARIFTTSLEAELVSIAGVYRTSDTALPKEVLGQPAQVWLSNDKLLMRGL